MALVEIGITGNAGYSTNQVRKMSVSELISELENFDSEDEVYLKDAGNRYGAAYGQINYIEQGLSEDYEDDDEDEYYESNLYSMIKSNQKLNESVDDTKTDEIFNLFVELANEIENKYNVSDITSKLNKSDMKVSEKWGSYNLYVKNYMTIPFLNCPLNIDFEFHSDDNKFKVRALLSNPDSTGFWSDVMKGKTLASGKYENNNIRFYKDKQ